MTAVPGQYAVEKDKIVAADRRALSHFGFAVTMSGEYAMIGTFSSAYIFEEQPGARWEQVAKLTNPEGGGAGFGRSLCMQGRYAFVGASGHDDATSELIPDAGAVFVYYRDATGRWTFSEKLTAPTRKASAFFGHAMSASDGLLAVGAYGHDNNRGAVFLFARDGQGKWVLTQEINASDKSSAYFFGKSLSLYERDLLVGAAAGGSKGRAYHFIRDDKNAWLENQKIDAPAEAASGFGRVVCVMHNAALISDESEKAVHAFNKDGRGVWKHTDLLKPNAQSADNLFGGSIALMGNIAVVGAAWEDEHQQGVVYLYKTTDSEKWQYLGKVIGSVSSPGDEFGYTLGVSNSKFIVGSYLDEKDETGANLLERAGSAYVFELSVPRPPVSAPNPNLIENCTPFLRDFRIPNVITPNGDPTNECFVIARLYDRTSLFVCDRYGRELYRNEDYSNDWCGENLPGGIYYWTIIQEKKHCSERLKGWVQILR
ncbi:MAG TPA: gliding motility-associated C-terminal domain-containing protein [Chryseosolibacter sp.]|nr:gliding motility-associated C-terminal domain-containing protein [Chryseosolibacter sp.]